MNVLVHPECTHEGVVLKADYVGSTEYIIQTLNAAEPGSAWAIGTELNLVRRLARQHPDKEIMFLDRTVLLLDDEPDRPAAPGMGFGKSGRRPRREPDRGRRRDPEMGAGGAGPHVGAARGRCTAGGLRLQSPGAPHGNHRVMSFYVHVVGQPSRSCISRMLSWRGSAMGANG